MIELSKAESKVSPTYKESDLMQSIKEGLEKTKSLFISPRKKYQTL